MFQKGGQLIQRFFLIGTVGGQLHGFPVCHGKRHHADDAFGVCAFAPLDQTNLTGKGSGRFYKQRSLPGMQALGQLNNDLLLSHLASLLSRFVEKLYGRQGGKQILHLIEPRQPRLLIHNGCIDVRDDLFYPLLQAGFHDGADRFFINPARRLEYGDAVADGCFCHHFDFVQLFGSADRIKFDGMNADLGKHGGSGIAGYQVLSLPAERTSCDNDLSRRAARRYQGIDQRVPAVNRLQGTQRIAAWQEKPD